jgi:hypothetical protein
MKIYQEILANSLYECPYNSISHLYWAFTQDIVPQEMGCPCVWQTKQLGDKLLDLGHETYFLQEGRHLAVVALIKDNHYLFDPYLLHTLPLNLSMLNKNHRSIVSEAYPFRSDTKGEPKNGKLEVRWVNEHSIKLVYWQFSQSKNTYKISRLFTLNLTKKIPSNVKIDVNEHIPLLFHPEQTTLSIRSVDRFSHKMWQIVYPIWKYHLEENHDENNILVVDNDGNTYTRNETKYDEILASAVNAIHGNKREIIDFIMKGVLLYEQHAPKEIDYHI